MPGENIIDVSDVIEQQKLGRFLIGLVLISWIITFFDGLDSNLISFAAPYFGAQYHLTKIQLGNIFSMGLFGHHDRRLRAGLRRRSHRPPPHGDLRHCGFRRSHNVLRAGEQLLVAVLRCA